MPNEIDARDVEVAFRKPGGEFVYLRVNEEAVRFLKLDPNKVYGVCHNGNVAVVAPDTRVVEVSIRGILRNAQDEADWDDTFAKGAGRYPELQRISSEQPRR